MLFGMVYNIRNATEATDRRTLKLFTNWTPPNGWEWKSLYEFADGSGGIATLEVTSSEVMYEGTATFRGVVDFRISPVVEIEAAIPILQKSQAWADSIS